MNVPVEENKDDSKDLLLEALKDVEEAVRFSLWEEFDKWLLEVSSEVQNSLGVLGKRWGRRQSIIRTVVDRFLNRFSPSEKEKARLKLNAFAEGVYGEWLQFKSSCVEPLQISHGVRLDVSRELEGELADLMARV